MYLQSMTLNVSKIPDIYIYPLKLQLSKANVSDEDTSVLDLKIKVIGSDVCTSVYDKRDGFGSRQFPLVEW